MEDKPILVEIEGKPVIRYGLKYYETSHKLYGELDDNLHIDTQEHITQMVHKLQRHFKIGTYPIEVNFVKNKWNGQAYPDLDRIDLPYNKNHCADLVMICEEIGHIWYHYLYPGAKRSHTKKLRRLTERMLDYCLKNNCWGWFMLEEE